MTAQHTPGPWYWIGDSLTHRQFDIYTPYGIDDRHEHVCTVNNLPHDRLMSRPLDRANANARLIAAAPELLEALEMAQELIEASRQYFPKSIKHGDKFKLENTNATIGRALAKARGK